MKSPKWLSKALTRSVERVLEAAYLVYCNECSRSLELGRLVPLSRDEFYLAVKNKLEERK